MKSLNYLLTVLASTNADDYVNIIVTVIRWVANAFALIGAALVIFQIIKSGIALSQSDSPEGASKAKKHLLYAILGLVLIISATVIVNVVMTYVPSWLEKNVPTN